MNSKSLFVLFVILSVINAAPVNDPSEDEWSELVPHGATPLKLTDVQAAMYNAMPDSHALVAKWIKQNNVDVQDPTRLIQTRAMEDTLAKLKVFMVTNGPSMLMTYGLEKAFNFGCQHVTGAELSTETECPGKLMMDAITTACEKQQGTPAEKVAKGVASFVAQSGASEMVKAGIKYAVQPWAKPSIIYLLPTPINWLVATGWTAAPKEFDDMFAQGVMAILCAGGDALIGWAKTKYVDTKKEPPAWLTGLEKVAKAVCAVKATAAAKFTGAIIEPWAKAEAMKITFTSNLAECLKATTEAEYTKCGAKGYIPQAAGDTQAVPDMHDSEIAGVANSGKTAQAGGDHDTNK